VHNLTGVQEEEEEFRGSAVAVAVRRRFMGESDG